jgi:hypothetical protein
MPENTLAYKRPIAGIHFCDHGVMNLGTIFTVTASIPTVSKPLAHPHNMSHSRLEVFRSSVLNDALLVTFILLAIMVVQAVRGISLRRKMPPGPQGLPWVGNKHQIPAVKPWRAFEKLNKQYGEHDLQ